jgi:hypothetical protein
MKNLHVLPTKKKSRLYDYGGQYYLQPKAQENFRNHHIYITSDEEIKEGDYFLYDGTKIRYKSNGTEYHGRDLCHISGNHRYPVSESKKIILTFVKHLKIIMETKKLIKLSSLVFLMIFVLILTVPLTTEIFGLMNTPNTVLNLIGVFIYLISWLVVVIVEYQLYKDFKKILNGETSPDNKEEEKTTNK